MCEIESMERGSICQMRRGPSGPAQKVYFNHQYWQGGRNHSSYVPGERVEALQAAIEGRERFEHLAEQFVDLTVAATRQEAAQDSKKNSSRKSGKRASAKPKAS